MAARTPSHAEDAALSLTLAVVASSPSPLALLDGELRVVALSDSFLSAFEIDRPTPSDSSFFDLGAGEWNLPQLRVLLAATASEQAAVEAYEIDLRRPHRPVRTLVIHALRLSYLDLDQVRLLVAVSDVTGIRADAAERAEALRHNEVLLQEARHRVANSLQIIASVLLQNARKTASEETRSHLKDAHSRVMSVAALERLLAGTGADAVELHAYLVTLCDSIAASMIADPERLSLSVTGADGLINGRVSVSLGLIVTELVINALKYAFPDGRAGKIVVHFEFHGPNWTLSVSDDGVGMPADRALIRTGLGTSIVAALAQQLHAVVEIEPSKPGTRVSVTHTQIALVAGGDIANTDAATAERPAA